MKKIKSGLLSLATLAIIVWLLFKDQEISQNTLITTGDYFKSSMIVGLITLLVCANVGRRYFKNLIADFKLMLFLFTLFGFIVMKSFFTFNYLFASKTTRTEKFKVERTYYSGKTNRTPTVSIIYNNKAISFKMSRYLKKRELSTCKSLSLQISKGLFGIEVTHQKKLHCTGDQ